MSLGRKQHISNAEWINTLKNIGSLVSKDKLDEAVNTAVCEIKMLTTGKKVAYAWSGGKDSLVLSAICERVGIHNSIFVHCNLEYPEFLAWCLANKPVGCKIVNTGQDITWLSKHQEMLFPGNSTAIGRWYSIVQHSGVRQYYNRNNLDMILLGRRKADGNHVGSGANIYTNKKGVTQYSPLADWSHELILAYIHYYDVKLPPIYEWKNGYFCGTHPWPSRMDVKNVRDGWQTVYEIDPSIVIDAAAQINSASDFLAEVAV